jgi:hypothetical protein
VNLHFIDAQEPQKKGMYKYTTIIIIITTTTFAVIAAAAAAYVCVFC